MEKNRKDAEAHSQFLENARAQIAGDTQQQPAGIEVGTLQTEHSKRLAKAHLDAQELWSKERDNLLQTQQQLQQQVDRQQDQIR